MTTISMYDSIDIGQIPLSATAVAGYVSGRWPTAAKLAATFPHAQLLTIATSASHDAECLDIETGDATPADAAAWYERQKARGITRPCLYASASVMQADVAPVLVASGIKRASVRLWSAHYTFKAHICGPDSCGALSIDADGTQWTDEALGRNLDESLLAADFFSGRPNWQEAMMQALPTLQQGSADDSGPLYVHRVQALVSGIGAWNKLGAITQVKQDGNFGSSTTSAVKRIQGFFGLTQDGIVGPVTWTVLVTGSAA